MPASTVQTTEPNRRIITRSGITLTTLHVPKPRSKVSPIEWVHRSDDSRPPFDWEIIGLGENYAFQDEVFRGHLPPQLVAGLPQLPFEDWFVAPLPVFFSPQGVSMKEILLWDPNVPQSAPRGVPIQWTDKVHDPLRDFWLRLRVSAIVFIVSMPRTVVADSPRMPCSGLGQSGSWTNVSRMTRRSARLPKRSQRRTRTF